MKIVNYFKIAFLLSLPILLNSCFDAEDPNDGIREESDRIVSEYIENNNITATKSNLNYYYEPIVENSSGKDIEAGDIVGIYYKINQLTGQHIDSLTESMGNPIKFIHVPNQEGITVPTVVNLGLTWMREGETYRFYVPSYLAYKSYSNDTLMPANANIKMDVTVAFATDSTGLANMENEKILNYLDDKGISNFKTLENGVYYYQIAAGTGSAPETGSYVDLFYKGFFIEDDEIFDQTTDNPASFQVGSNNTIPGFRLGIKEMVKGEKGVVLMPSAMAYGARSNLWVLPPEILEDNQDPIPPFAPLGFELEMVE